ncbi:MAG: hypothetical protein K6A23_10255 [Butyrivibrio sp.]|nr:hypothetical protein [Butyrivibrio sp.]
MSENNQEIKNEESVDSKVLEEIRKACSREAFYSRLTAVFVGGLFLVVAISLVLIVPKAIYALNNANSLIDDTNKLVLETNAAVDELSEITGELETMVDSVTSASNNMNKLVEDNAEDLTQAVQNMSEIDFEGLNKAIADLQTAVGPLAKLFGGN